MRSPDGGRWVAATDPSAGQKEGHVFPEDERLQVHPSVVYTY